MPPKGRRKGDTMPDLRDTEERNALFMANQALICWTLGKLPVQVNALGWQAAYDLAELALLRACGQWDPERGALSTLMFRATMNALNHEMHRVGRVKAPSLVGWNDIMSDVGAGLDAFVELGHPDPPAAESAEDRQLLRELFRRLPWRERDVVQLRYLRELTLKETGQRLGLSKERVRQLATQALERLREAAGLEPAGVARQQRLDLAAQTRARKLRAQRRRRRKEGTQS